MAFSADSIGIRVRKEGRKFSEGRTRRLGNRLGLPGFEEFVKNAGAAERKVTIDNGQLPLRYRFRFFVNNNLPHGRSQTRPIRPPSAM